MEQRPQTGQEGAQAWPWTTTRARAAPARQRAGHVAEGRPLLAVEKPEDLTENQQTMLAWIAATDPRLYRAYLLKEGLRLVFQMPYTAAVTALDRWISWARRCRIPAFVKLQKSIVKHRSRILAAIQHKLSNGLIESTNTKIRLITRTAYGFHTPQPLIALSMLTLGGHRPTLPDRN